MQKYSVNQHLVETLLIWVKSGEIAIPEIQRPFVWSSSKVRDLMDSLYHGFPVGYVISWQNPNVKLKDGSVSQGKKILIDGQQRITALSAAILANKIVNKDYKKESIKIAFNPIDEKFEVQNPAILKDKTWLPDISMAINGDLFEIAENYFKSNPNVDQKKVRVALQKLTSIPKKQIGVIELSSDLDVETVTQIFIRINSTGVSLSQADFAMSKIAADTENGGVQLRKLIDYFCHLSNSPDFYQNIIDNDEEFVKTSDFNKISWRKSENEDLYNPSYNDLIRVAFTSQFDRGKLSDLVSLLSGRNFESRTYEAEVAKNSFNLLRAGVESFVNKTNFQRFLMIIKSAGFVSPKLIRSQNVLNFSYILYLKLISLGENTVNIERYVKKWLVYSILTGRYSGSSDSTFDTDIKQISQKPFVEYLAEKEKAELSDAFWDASLPQSLNTSVASSPYFLIFLASQVKANDKGFLSKDITIRELIEHRGDIHHIFPKSYLSKNNLGRGQYNQIANYVYMQSEINIKIGNKPPCDYFSLIKSSKISPIFEGDELLENLKVNCIPENVMSMGIDSYQAFLLSRRKLMAKKIKEYYFSL